MTASYIYRCSNNALHYRELDQEAHDARQASEHVYWCVEGWRTIDGDRGGAPVMCYDGCGGRLTFVDVVDAAVVGQD